MPDAHYSKGGLDGLSMVINKRPTKEPHVPKRRTNCTNMSVAWYNIIDRHCNYDCPPNPSAHQSHQAQSRPAQHAHHLEGYEASAAHEQSYHPKASKGLDH